MVPVRHDHLRGVMTVSSGLSSGLDTTVLTAEFFESGGSIVAPPASAQRWEYTSRRCNKGVVSFVVLSMWRSAELSERRIIHQRTPEDRGHQGQEHKVREHIDGTAPPQHVRLTVA